MMNRADDAIARWEARNAPQLIVEAEARRRARIIAFTRVDLMRAVLAEAARRAAAALGVPAEGCRAALVPNEETKRLMPAIEFAAGVEVDATAARRIFGFAFRQVSLEWAFDLALVNADARAAPAIAASLSRKESLEQLAERVKAWLAV